MKETEYKIQYLPTLCPCPWHVNAQSQETFMVVDATAVLLPPIELEVY